MSAKFLYKLGLKRHPDLKDLVLLSSQGERNQEALKYLVDNLATTYTDYDPSHWNNVAFVPALKPDGTPFLCKPLEVKQKQPFIVAISR
jgi:hypothetical protein